MTNSTHTMALIISVFSLLSACGNAEKKPNAETSKTQDFQISLAQWSLHRSFFGESMLQDWNRLERLLRAAPDSALQGERSPMDFPDMAAAYGIRSIELVNTFYLAHTNDSVYWTQFKNKCQAAQVEVGLIMCDALGNLADADSLARHQAVLRHHAWVDVCQFLGAKAIRVNAAGEGTPEEISQRAAESLSALAQYAATKGIQVLVENHGGVSSNGAWLAALMQRVNKPNVGTLPDFGNFCIQRGPQGCLQAYDRYQGMSEILPYAKALSAKSLQFDAQGNETTIDYPRMLKLAKEAGYKGYIGIEYEGQQLTEDQGIRATLALLQRAIAEL